ncbi:hypothetical protein HPB47_003973 [Ixodes persulcatus]|uniref:Uncharacterized protein n=1 Tax=Ixodes persulcatus TaxID=34615 RepID=A0AC60PGW8_IXOPE|nr:hypothetical protein HPB47_003973 [Ixodes persulcatus]
MAAAYVVYLLQQQRDAERNLRQQRVFRTPRTLDTIADNHLARYYRLPRPAMERLCAALAPALRRPTARNCALPVDAQVLLALRFYASGSFQSVVGDVANMSQTSASRIINSVSSALCNFAEKGIKFPVTPQAAMRTARGNTPCPPPPPPPPRPAPENVCIYFNAVNKIPKMSTASQNVEHFIVLIHRLCGNQWIPQGAGVHRRQARRPKDCKEGPEHLPKQKRL